MTVCNRPEKGSQQSVARQFADDQGRKRPTEKPEVFNPNAFENRCQADLTISLKTGTKRGTQPDVTTQ